MTDETQPQNRHERPHEQRPELPTIPGDSSAEETRAIDARSSTRHMPPAQQSAPARTAPQAGPPPLRGVPPAAPPRTRPPQPIKPGSRHGVPGSARARRDSGLYLPVWSLALMLLIVLGIAGGLVLLVIALGGTTPPPSSPVIVISTAIPTARPDSFPPIPASPTIPPAFDPGSRPQGPLVLSGPTLAPVILTATPRPIAIGERVVVVDVGVQQLNVRNIPGVNGSTVVFRAQDGTIFTVVDGPTQGDGLTWWRVQDLFDPNRSGWAASNYLRAETQP